MRDPGLYMTISRSLKVICNRRRRPNACFVFLQLIPSQRFEAYYMKPDSYQKIFYLHQIHQLGWESLSGEFITLLVAWTNWNVP